MGTHTKPFHNMSFTFHFFIFTTLILKCVCQQNSNAYEIDDNDPDEENFCVLHENGEPINCNTSDDGKVRSSMDCTGVEQGSLATTCKFENICYDGRNRDYIPVADAYRRVQNSMPFYDGTKDWVYFSEDSNTKVPPIALLGHRSKNEFSANVSTALLDEDSDEIEWVNGVALFSYRQYHQNYYHIIMDDMIGMWWTVYHHFQHAEELPRDVKIVVLDDQGGMGMDGDNMLSALTVEPIVKRSDLHTSGKLVCFRRALVGQAERSWGGPGRRFIKPEMLRQFHQFLRNGARALATAQIELEEETRSGIIEDLSIVSVEKPRAAVLFRKSTRLVLNEQEVLDGLRQAFPRVEFFEFRPEQYSFAQQVWQMMNTTLLIGVHGAGLTNHLFLPDQASLLEILPYHWERHAYGRISALLGYHYFAWRNTDKSKTVFHESIFDGIPGVPEADKEIIRNANEKPMSLKSPGSLAAEKYWINQDTIVNVPELIEVVRKALSVGLNAELLSETATHTEL